MAKQGISTGTSPNDGTGDSLLVGATKINLNFNEVYTTIGDGTTLAVPVTSVTAGTGINLSGSTGSVTITNTGIANTNNLRTDFLEVSGISTLSGGLEVTGNATATQFVGGGAGITGISTLNIVNYSGGGAGGSGVGTDNVRTNTLVVAGVSTLGITSITNLTSQQLNVSGVSTFSDDINVNAHVSFKAGSGNSQLYMYDENAIYLGTNNDARLIYNNTGNIAKFERFGSAGEIEIDAAPVTLKHSDSTKLQTSSTGITVDGNLSVGIGSTEVTNTPALTLSHNNPTVVSTAGTTGQFKQIGGQPYYYDGTTWRALFLSEAPLTVNQADSDWDNTMIRMNFDQANYWCCYQLKGWDEPRPLLIRLI